MSDKETNPKDAIASNKVPLNLWPATATLYGSMGLLEGRCKYGQSNFRHTGVRASVYIAALKRHIDEYNEGLDEDADSDLHPLCHILADAGILVEAIVKGNLVDDRAYATNYVEAVEKMTPHVARIQEKYKDRDVKHYDRRDSLDELCPPASGELVIRGKYTACEDTGFFTSDK